MSRITSCHFDCNMYGFCDKSIDCDEIDEIGEYKCERYDNCEYCTKYYCEQTTNIED